MRDEKTDQSLDETLIWQHQENVAHEREEKSRDDRVSVKRGGRIFRLERDENDEDDRERLEEIEREPSVLISGEDSENRRDERKHCQNDLCWHQTFPLSFPADSLSQYEPLSFRLRHGIAKFFGCFNPEPDCFVRICERRLLLVAMCHTAAHLRHFGDENLIFIASVNHNLV